MTESSRPDALDHAAEERLRPSPPSESLGLKDDFIMALRLFSRLPTGESPHRPPDLSRIAMALPLASLAMGVGPALLLMGGVAIGLPGHYAATLAVAAMILVTGAMAEDALADAADGLFGGRDVERRLEIMKDSRHGSYGVAAMIIFILLRVLGLGAIAGTNPMAAAGLWLACGIAGRSLGLGLAVALPPARATGLAAHAGRPSRTSFIIGLALTALLLIVLAGPATSLIAIILAAGIATFVMLGWIALCKRLVGGQTGDLIGAGGALVEIAVLTALLPFV